MRRCDIRALVAAAAVTVALVSVMESPGAAQSVPAPAQSPAASGTPLQQPQSDAKIPAPIASADHIVLFAGGQIDSANVGYLGGTFALPGSTIGKGVALRGSGFFGNYVYQNAALGTIDATFGGGEVDGVYQFSTRDSWTNLALGVRDVNTSLTPFDDTNRRHGTIAELTLSLDGGGVTGPYRIDYYGSYGTRLDDYAARVSLTHTITSQLRLGVETSFEGDPTYALQRIGPYTGVRLGSKSELQLSVGASKQTSRDVGGYLRVGIYHSF